MPEAPGFLEGFSFLTHFILLVVLLGGLGMAVARTSLSFAAKVKTWSVVVAVILAWFGVALYLSTRGVFETGDGTPVPPIPFAIVLPVVVGLLLLMRSAAFAAVIDATPLSWMIGMQFYRVLGVVFLMLWAGGHVPGEFALPAGIGDILVGVIALPVAYLAARGFSRTREAAYAWNTFGILDLVVAVSTGFLTSPGPLQQLAMDNPNYLTTAYPLVMIPAFAVPVSLILHGLCIWKLRRLRADEHTAKGSPVATEQDAPMTQ